MYVRWNNVPEHIRKYCDSQKLIKLFSDVFQLLLTTVHMFRPVRLLILYMYRFLLSVSLLYINLVILSVSMDMYVRVSFLHLRYLLLLLFANLLLNFDGVLKCDNKVSGSYYTFWGLCFGDVVVFVKSQSFPVYLNFQFLLQFHATSCPSSSIQTHALNLVVS